MEAVVCSSRNEELRNIMNIMKNLASPQCFFYVKSTELETSEGSRGEKEALSFWHPLLCLTSP